MKFVILTVCFLLFNTLQAQDRPSIFPEDIESTTLQANCLCKPGVTNKLRGKGLDISFLQIAKAAINEEEGYPLSSPSSELILQQLSFKLRFPIINKDGFKMIAGAVYRTEFYNFQKIGADYQSIFGHLNEEYLKSNGVEISAVKSWNDKFYSSVRFRYLANGDYSGFINFDQQYAIYNLSGFFGVKKSEDKEWGLGLNFSQSFRRTIVLPFFLYNHTFNNKWGLEMVLPALVTLRRNFTEKSVMFFGIRYNSRSYSIETEDMAPQIFNLNHSELRGAITFDQRIHPWIWLQTRAGVQYNFSTDFEASDDAAMSFEVEPGTSPFFKVGVFVSPPSSFFK